MNMMSYFSENNREMVSFSGKCPFQCLHCYTFSEKYNEKFSQAKSLSSIEEIITDLKRKNEFKVVYVSGYNENFIDTDKGLDLVEALFFEFKCHILFTTRNVFSEEHILRVNNLNKLMRYAGKCLFACVSISAYDSYKKIEIYDKIPSPEKRVTFLKQLYENGIISLLALRPICPNLFIPTKEYLEILEKSYEYCNAVITSGIYVTDNVIKRLKTFPMDFNYVEKEWVCFRNMSIKIVDVHKELNEIRTFCKNKNILVFDESISAINHFYNQLYIEKTGQT